MRRSSLLWTALTLTTLMLASAGGPAGGGSAAVPAGDWMDHAWQGILSSEYRFSPAPGGAFSAPNRAHGLRVRADASGVQVTPRAEDRPSWALSLRLQGIGREGAMVGALPGPVRTGGNRIEQRHETLGLTEWYVNDRGGLEQGFTIDARPVSGPGDSPLILEVAYSGGLKARQDGADAVVFAAANDRRVVSYAGLRVADAEGNPVGAELGLVPGALRLTVRDAGHPYPLVVDPTVVSASWEVLGDQFDERFGNSVSGAGDVNGDGFADVIVGAPQFDGGFFDEGRAFVFLGSSTGPAPLPAWTADGGQAGAWFGYSVASAGDVNRDGFGDIIVGARLYDNVQIDEGRAFVYLGSASGLGSTPAWTAEPDQAGALFGSSVASAGDVNGDGYGDVIVGAPSFDTPVNVDEGRAFVYLGSATGLSTSPWWSAGSNLFSSAYGASVARAGDVNGDGFGDIIVGAPLYDNAGFPDEGRVFVYLGPLFDPNSPGTTNPIWTFDSNKTQAQLGYSVAGAGDVNGDGFADVIIGAPFLGSGQVFVFNGSAAGPSLSPDWNAKINKSPAEFGSSVAGAGDVNGDGIADIVVGAPRTGSNSTAGQGSVRVYYGSRMGLANTPAFSIQGAQANALFGGSVASAGDVNRDGLADFIVGSIGLDNAPAGAANAGGADLFLGFRTRKTAITRALHGVRFTD